MEHMIKGRDRGRLSSVSAKVVIGRDVFGVVEAFMYLGLFVTCDFD